MIIIPAIDIKDGSVVRLTQGDYARVTRYSQNPVNVARGFKESGAELLHVVDLDGAKDGQLSNFDTVKEIINKSEMAVEVGGGVRDEKRISDYLSAGALRVILGTSALQNQDFLRRMIDKYKERIAVGVDAKNGFVAVNGWTEISETDSFDFCVKLKGFGVKTVIYTDIAKDGAMRGTNIAAYDRLRKIEGLDIIASGGISFYEEIRILSDMGIYGAILGKSLYSGTLELNKAISVSKGEPIQC